MAQEDQILVIERKVFDEIGDFHGLTFDVDRYLDKIFANGVPRFMPRSAAEKNPDYKQLIPYVIMSCEGKYLSYVRGKRAGEKRLLGNRSIGIGGHINPCDDAVPLFNVDFRETYQLAVDREVDEEVCVETGHTNSIVALLNDDSNEVGRVHLGIVHHWVLEAEKVSRREQMITQMAFMSGAELSEVRDSLETWSQLCLDGLTEVAEAEKAGGQ